MPYKDKNKQLDYQRNYQHSNKEVLKQRHKLWYLQHRAEILKKRAVKIKNDPLLSLCRRIRKLVWININKQGYTKRSRTFELLGCSKEELLIHLGPKPEGAIHLDHICPCSQSIDEVELIKLQHYSNLRWLAASENLSKNDSATPEAIEMCKKLLNRDWIF